MKLTIGFMIIVFGTACIEKQRFSIHDYCLFNNKNYVFIVKKGIFNTIVNSEMCEFKSTDEDIYNDILFDTHWSDEYKDVSLINSELITKMRKEKCFVATPYGSNSAGQTYLYVFKNFGILYTRTYNPNWYRDESQSFIHNLPNHILFVLKYDSLKR
jgi:hypothetical protein